MGLKIVDIHHISVVVADTDTALRFYRDVLGLEVNDARPDLGYPGAWLNVGERQQIHLLEVTNVDPREGRPPHVGRDRHAAFRVNDIAQLSARLTQAAVAFTASRSGRRALFCRDPDGNGLEFIEMVAPRVRESE